MVGIISSQFPHFSALTSFFVVTNWALDKVNNQNETIALKVYPCCSQSEWEVQVKAEFKPPIWTIWKNIKIFLFSNTFPTHCIERRFWIVQWSWRDLAISSNLKKFFCWKSQSWVLNAIQIGQLAKSLNAVCKFCPDDAAQLLNHNKVEYIFPPTPDIVRLLFQEYMLPHTPNIFCLLLKEYISSPPPNIFCLLLQKNISTPYYKKTFSICVRDK